jgi:DNA-binding NarL/FixJ family response regulator
MRSYLMGTLLLLLPVGRRRGMVRVLVVDNNAEFLEVLVRLLDRQPDIAVVAQAASLAEARGKLSGVDVAILDRGLPDGDGLELISELREASPSVKVLVMSAFAEMAKPPEALEAGADRVLGKVAPPDEVFTTIRELGGEQSTSMH